MLLIDAANAADYLRDVGRIRQGQAVRVDELTGGVSNLVLRVSFPDGDGEDFVLKQGRPQLRTPDPWFCGVERIWREVDCLTACHQIVEAARVQAGDTVLPLEVPRILFEDRENFLFAMSAAPADHTVWKAELLAGRADEAITADCGRLLAILHAGAWGDASLRTQLSDRRIFEELRLTPYYRATARAHPNEAAHFERLIASSDENLLTLVHADFSPKNLLVFPVQENATARRIMLVDFETGHFGDPAFDLGFFLSHLILKAVYHAPGHEPYLQLTERFWRAYEAIMRSAAAEKHDPLAARGIQHFAGCAWARIDGVSKVDYLADEPRRQLVRDLARAVLADSAASWSDVLAQCRERLNRGAFHAAHSR